MRYYIGETTRYQHLQQQKGELDEHLIFDIWRGRVLLLLMFTRKSTFKQIYMIDKIWNDII